MAPPNMKKNVLKTLDDFLNASEEIKPLISNTVYIKN